MTTVTQWFAHDVKPVHVGEYEVLEVGMRFWSGRYWVHPSGLLVEIMMPWRGLAEEQP